MKKFLIDLPVLFWLGSAVASKLTICNQHTSDTLKINMLYNNSYFKPLTDSWKVYGWMDVPPGRCQPIVQHSNGVQTFLAVRKKTRFGQVLVMRFPFGEDDGQTKTAERFFCVRDEPHDRVLKTLNEHERCPPGWYAQLFNLYVSVPPNTNFTLQLGASRSP